MVETAAAVSVHRQGRYESGPRRVWVIWALPVCRRSVPSLQCGRPRPTGVGDRLARLDRPSGEELRAGEFADPLVRVAGLHAFKRFAHLDACELAAGAEILAERMLDEGVSEPVTAGRP